MSTSSGTSLILIHTPSYIFLARLHTEAAPKTCQTFTSLLPLTTPHIHVRWSGEALWIPQGEQDFGLKFENHTSHPSVGEYIWYPGGYSEAEILVAYGSCSFSSKLGQLAGNHFMSIIDGRPASKGDEKISWKKAIRELGVQALWEGKQEVRYEMADSDR
jgi:hypothetical protein